VVDWRSDPDDDGLWLSHHHGLRLGHHDGLWGHHLHLSDIALLVMIVGRGVNLLNLIGSLLAAAVAEDANKNYYEDNTANDSSDNCSKHVGSLFDCAVEVV